MVDEVLRASGKTSQQDIQQVKDKLEEEELTLEMLADSNQTPDDFLKVY